MAKWKYALVLTAFIVGGTQARAQLPPTDGCAILASLIYTESGGNINPGTSGATGRSATAVFDKVTVCNHTTKTVTRAFTASMQRLNIYVSWGGGRRGSGDYCASHYLEQCYPNNNPYMPPMSDGDFAFVTRRWGAVKAAVTPTVANGQFGDVSRFRQDDLRLNIRRAYASQVRVLR